MGKVKIKKDDQVLVIAGKDRGQTGRVLRVLPTKGRAVVEGVNMIKRHTRPNPAKQVQGGIVEREAAIHISNLMVIDPTTKKRVRVGVQRSEDGKAHRFAKQSGSSID